MGTLGTTWSLMKASWDVVRNNKGLLILPVFSAVCLLIVLASFVAPTVAAGTSLGREPSAMHAAVKAKAIAVKVVNRRIIFVPSDQYVVS